MGIINKKRKFLMPVFLLLAVLILINANVGTVSAQMAVYSTAKPVSTSYGPNTQPLTPQLGPSLPLSPTNSVFHYNVKNNAFLITCPDPPTTYPTDTQYFYTDPTSYIAGDQCLADSSPLNSQVNAILTISYSDTALPVATPSVNVTNPAALATRSISYSPSVDGDISTTYGVQSNIFDSIPAGSQRVTWAWFAKYINFNNVGTISNNAAFSGSYTSGACDYTYSYSATYTVSNFKNYDIPFTIKTPSSGIDTINTQVLPYLLYHSNVTNLNLVSNALNLSLSGDIYSPSNYWFPAFLVDPYPIDTPDLFYAQYQPSKQSAAKLTPFGRNGYGGTGLGVNLSFPQPIISLLGSPGSSGPVGTGGGGACPNEVFPSYLGPGTQPPAGPPTSPITADQAFACASEAGFTGESAFIIVAIANVESGLNPGEYNSAGAQGIVQLLGHPACENACAFNPYTAMQFALTLNGGPGGDWSNWLPYEGTENGEPEMCKYMPATGPDVDPTLCPNGGGGINVPTGTAPSSVSQIGITNITAVSMAAISSDYLFVLGNISNTQGIGTGGSSSMVQAALTQIGVPYCWGGESPRGSNPFSSSPEQCNGGNGLTPGISATSGGFDCSGLVDWAANKTGITVFGSYTGSHGPSTTGEWATLQGLNLITFNRANTVPGDLVFFDVPTDGPKQPGHVGICADDGCINMIDAPETGGYVEEVPVPEDGIMGFGELPSSTSTGNGASSPSNVSIFVIKMIDKGQYNTSVYQPNSIPPTQSNAKWTASWNDYWNNVTQLQNSSSYVINSIYVNISQTAPVLSEKKFGLAYSSFEPWNITADSFGTVYITGVVNFSDVFGKPLAQEPILVRVTNTISGGTPTITANFIIDPPEADGSTVPIAGQKWREITVSPTGGVIYLADPSDHNILSYGGNSLSYTGCFDLVFANSQSCGLVNAGCTIGAFNAGESTVPNLNLSEYFLDGGFEGINASAKNSESSVELYAILQSANIGDNSAAGDTLDRDCFHSPLGIQNINGYLYILDNWGGKFGQKCANLVFHICSHGGVEFNMLMLRVVNSTGSDVQISPNQYPDIWLGGGSFIGAGGGLSRVATPNQTIFPPYGWILTANVSGDNSEFQPPVKFCSSNGKYCAYTGATLTICAGDSGPNGNCTQPTSPNISSYKPLLPSIEDWNCKNLGFSFGCHVPNFVGTGVRFAVGINNTVTVFIPPQKDAVRTLSYVANQHAGLAIINFNVENYTKTIGTIGPQTNATCYVDNKSNSNLNGGRCFYNANIQNIVGPVYPADNPFEYTESIGTSRTLTFPGYFYSSFGAGSASNPDGASISSLNSSYQNSFANVNANQCATDPSCNPALQSNQALQLTSINSMVQGYVLVPYTYNYQLTQTITQTNDPGPACTSISSGPTTSSGTEYTYAQSGPPISNPLSANIEGGASYVQYFANDSLYQEHLSSISLPPDIIYGLFTNRKIGDVYINATFEPTDNRQGIVNATRLLNYSVSTYTLGGQPAYQTISSSPVQPACTGAACASPLANPASTIDPLTNLTTNQSTQPALVSLFNWDRYMLYSTVVNLKLNGSTTQTVPKYALGYHRLVYVYNDRFNNTFYMPIDADIANLTNITLKINPIVNASNPNQTLIPINGTAFYTPPFSLTNIPLKGGKIYFYYDEDINYPSISPQTDPNYLQDVQLCTFGNGSKGPQISRCVNSNPVYTGLQPVSDLINYKPAFNPANNSCAGPAKGLLNRSPFDCNIYGADKTLYGATCASSGLNTQYCIPYAANGTGYCSSQLGLIGNVTTDQNGNFSLNVTACGSGYHTIIAKYYGTPAPEPITVTQPSIDYAYDPNYPQSVSFQANNYSWTPETSTESVAIGSFLISYGAIGILVLVSAIVIILAIWFAKSTLGRPKKQTRKRIKS